MIDTGGGKMKRFKARLKDGSIILVVLTLIKLVLLLNQ
jgi:hypothetical protein